MSDDTRFVDIEIKLVHQDKSLEELSDVLYKQQQRIDSLEKILSDLSKRVQAGAKDELEIGPADDKPPHY